MWSGSWSLCFSLDYKAAWTPLTFIAIATETSTLPGVPAFRCLLFSPSVSLPGDSLCSCIIVLSYLKRRIYLSGAIISNIAVLILQSFGWFLFTFSGQCMHFRTGIHLKRLSVFCWDFYWSTLHVQHPPSPRGSLLNWYFLKSTYLREILPPLPYFQHCWT